MPCDFITGIETEDKAGYCGRAGVLFGASRVGMMISGTSLHSSRVNGTRSPLQMARFAAAAVAAGPLRAVGTRTGNGQRRRSRTARPRAHGRLAALPAHAPRGR